MAAITVRGLTRTFGEVTAVDGLDLTIERGEIYGLLGPNGAGKSTTVKMLCTLLAPTGGKAVVAGHDVATQPKAVRLRIGVALQDVALDPKQTGLELLRLQGQLYGLRRDEIEQRLVELRALVDIGDALDRRIGTYSGGMKRRGSTWPPRSCTTPRSCSSTSRPPGSTRSAGPRCGRRCDASTGAA